MKPSHAPSRRPSVGRESHRGRENGRQQVAEANGEQGTPGEAGLRSRWNLK